MRRTQFIRMAVGAAVAILMAAEAPAQTRDASGARVIARCDFEGQYSTGEYRVQEGCFNNWEWGRKDMVLQPDRDAGRPGTVQRVQVRGIATWRTALGECGAHLYGVLINSRGRTLTRYYDPSGAPSTFDAFSPWRPALDVRVSHTPRVWIARLALPFAELHAASGLTACWRANFAQVRSLPGDTPPAETLAWAPMYGRRRLLERCGRLDFEGWTRHAGNRRRKFAFVPDVDPRPAPPPPAATAARDALFGMAFATPCCGCAVGGRGTILRTADGGTSWTVIPSGTDAVLQAVAFGDAHHGCAVGGVRRDQRHDIGASAGVILATEDGGVTWRTALGECGAHLYGVSFGDARTVYAAGEYGTVWKSLNRGRTWRPCAATGTPRWLFALHAIDAAHVVAVGEEGAIIVTRDGGVTWRTASAPLFAAPYGFSATLRAVHFADRRHGWAAGDRGVLLRTRDGGGTWESCTLPLEAGARDAFAIRAVRFRTPREGWLAGAPGSAMFRTADGGTTWHREPCDTALGLHALHLLPDGAAWAAGECGMRLRRVPGGDRWRHAGGGESLPGLLYVTPHAHHLDAIPWPALLQRHTLFFAGGKRDLAPHNLTGEGSPQNLQAAALRYGFRALRCFADLPGDRRREPHRIHQVYQAWQGVEILERRLVAVIRSLRPATVIAEWAILAEGYWAMDVALMARALTRAFASAADPAAFPELAALGLAPWRAGTLFIHHLGWPADLYRVHHRRDWTLRARGTDPVPSLGITLGEARFRAACEWGSLLDRARLKRAADYRRATSVAHFHRATDAPRKETPA